MNEFGGIRNGVSLSVGSVFYSHMRVTGIAPLVFNMSLLVKPKMLYFSKVKGLQCSELYLEEKIDLHKG